jgi:[protein-PII] uridylyltransferase
MTASGSLARQDEIIIPDKDSIVGKLAYTDLRESRERLFCDFSVGKIKGDFQENYSEIIDQYFRISIQESETGQELFKKKIPFALVAVGGYGRSELCLFSDIDILVLFRKKIPTDAKNLSEELFYPLWDLGLELGYGVRTIRDCVKLSKDDFEVLTSIMDARFLCGDSLLYLDLMEELQKKVIDRYSLKLIHWLEGRNRLRMNNFGDATHLLEPNLKDGIGGLRDYHHIIWMAKALYNIRDARELEYLGKLSYQEYHELKKEVQFILFVRNHLHQLSNRKNDRLNFEYQEEIAKRLGFKKTNKIPPVEQFLGKLHSSMEVIKILHQSFLQGHAVKKRKNKTTVVTKNISKGLHIIHDELSFNSATVILSDPSIIMDIFVQSSKHGIPLSMDARRLVKEFLSLIDDNFRRSSKIFNSFLDIINNNNAENSFNQMFETGFLDTYIPEFGHIRDRVQFDAYHIFPVGRHVLETFYQLKNISKEKDLLLVDTFADLRNHEILFLAALFHDIGKTGKGHARRGVKITRDILNRFNYSKEATDEVLFLIENHLFLAETATRRDLDDEKIIIHAARKIGTIERLKALHLLTWADSSATGPRAWNDWTCNLVQELFFKILHILEMGELATPDTSQKINRLKRQLRRLTADILGINEFDHFFEIMPPRYKLITPAADIMHHYEMMKDLKRQIDNQQTNPFVFNFRENKQGGFWEVSFVAKDRPGLFSDIAGVMALNNINILSSNIYTWRDGTAVDVFSVTRPLDTINPDKIWNRVRRDFENTFSGKLALSYRLSKKAVPIIGSSSKKPSLPPSVNIDNKSSDFFTLIETFASDRIGLLYIITRTLFDLRLDIRIAKTGVKGDQTADVFYVRDFDGQKLEDDAQVNEVKMALLHQLQSEFL